jgi:hypothetical protein
MKVGPVHSHHRAGFRGAVLSGLLVIGAVALILAPAGCSRGTGTTTSGRVTSTTAGSSQTVEGEVGKALDVGGVKVEVTGLASVAQPLFPATLADPDGLPLPLAAGRVFYQAWVKVENKGDQVVRVDPRDFVLTYERKTYLPDLRRSGPDVRSLIMTASTDLILTFEVPEGAKPDLLYRPSWYGGRVLVKGEMKPAGMI